MISAITDIYAIYAIYKTINAIKLNPNDPVSKNTCQTLKQQIINGGCIYIKFAQWMVSKLRSSTGHGIETLVASLDTLFDQCPYHDIEHTHTLFKQSFGGKDIDSQLTHLELIASGSVGQVYRAILNKPYVVCTICDCMVSTRIMPLINPDNNDNNDNNDKTCNNNGARPILICECEHGPNHVKVIKKVAIKVKHPGIDEEIANKLGVFKFMAKLQKIKWIKDMLSLHVDFKDFMDNIIRQADFRGELSNNRQLRSNFRDNHLVYFPLAITASRDVMISEYVSGQSLDNIGEYQQMKCCLNYACMVAQMVLVDNFCHGDLHKGNWCVSLNTVPRNIAHIDASMVHLPQNLDSAIGHDNSCENTILRIGGDLRNDTHISAPPPSPINNVNDTNANVNDSDANVNDSGVNVNDSGANVNDTNANVNDTNANVNDTNANVNDTNANVNDTNANVNDTNSMDYAIVVFDTGICFSNDDINVNRKIWEAFERSSLDYLLEIVKYIIVGDYDETILAHIKEILTLFRDDNSGMLPLFDKLNEILITYNCCLSTIALNITIMFSLINETLKKHNLISNQYTGSDHNAVVRAKILDLICYAKSRDIYSELVIYLLEKERIRYSDIVAQSKLNQTTHTDNANSIPFTDTSKVELFGKTAGSTLIFCAPDDCNSDDSDSDYSDLDECEDTVDCVDSEELAL